MEPGWTRLGPKRRRASLNPSKKTWIGVTADRDECYRYYGCLSMPTDDCGAYLELASFQ